MVSIPGMWDVYYSTPWWQMKGVTFHWRSNDLNSDIAIVRDFDNKTIVSFVNLYQEYKKPQEAQT